MHNIWKIFTTDIRRISNNVVAVVIIMGLSILPALMVWQCEVKTLKNRHQRLFTLVLEIMNNKMKTL